MAQVFGWQYNIGIMYSEPNRENICCRVE